MKKILSLLAILPFVFFSCGDDDEPEINPIVGEWVLDKITISDPPEGHIFASTPTPTNTILLESSYELEFLANMTYERTINGTRSFGRIDEDGAWELDGQSLDLDVDNTTVQDLPTRFTVDGDITDQMTLITQDLWFAWPPEIVNDPNNPLDTVDFSNSDEANAFFGEYGAIVNFTFTMEFEKQ
ncbi:MAG: hypothetical protein AAGA66_03900 [Bacteroidota bacterium]